jgi:hypothetical protein
MWKYAQDNIPNIAASAQTSDSHRHSAGGLQRICREHADRGKQDYTD